MKKKFLLLLSLALLLVSCAAVKTAVVTLAPAVEGEQERPGINGLTASQKKETVKVSARYVPFPEIKKAAINGFSPYGSDTKQFFSVFEITVVNEGSSAVYFDPYKCVMLDGRPEQHKAISEQGFKEIFKAMGPSLPERAGEPRPQVAEEERGEYAEINRAIDRLYGYQMHYPDDHFKKDVIAKTLLKPGNIVPGEVKRGWAVFDLARLEAPYVSLVIPELGTLEFKFKFEQSVSIEETKLEGR